MSAMKKLYKLAKTIEMDPKQKAKQRESFVYGSTKIENEKITRELVRESAAAIKQN